MTTSADDRARIRRQRTEQAINLAMQSKWEEAIGVNRSLLALFPQDVDAFNRLGKALSELGRYGEARSAYSRTLELDSANSIAKKNLLRLEALGDSNGGGEARQKVDPDLFIEETGKTGVTQLQQVDAMAVRRMSAGDLVLLNDQENQLQVTDPAGALLGVVEPRLALRLTNLMKSGNQYAAAIASIGAAGESARIIIKETLQSPENAGKLSFPTSTTDGFRAYTKDRLVRRDLDEDEIDAEEHDVAEDWEGGDEPEEGPEFSFERRRSAEAHETDEEFEE